MRTTEHPGYNSRCDCGQSAIKKLGNAFICQRCYDIDHVIDDRIRHRGFEGHAGKRVSNDYFTVCIPGFSRSQEL